MINMFDSEVYACDSDGYAEYFSSISKNNQIKKDKKSKITLSNNEIKNNNPSKYFEKVKKIAIKLKN